MNEPDKLTILLIGIVLWVVSMFTFVWASKNIISALDRMALSYSSHNSIKCERVEIFHSENYDVAEGTGIKEWLEECKAKGTLEEKK